MIGINLLNSKSKNRLKYMFNVCQNIAIFQNGVDYLNCSVNSVPSNPFEYMHSISL